MYKEGVEVNMAKIFITGSADGLGRLAAESLVKQGHQVVLHARNKERALEAQRQVPQAETTLIADLANMEETKDLAKKVNALGSFDAIIHNAGIYIAPNKQIFAVNSLAPYILTCLIKPPKRLIYLSSSAHSSGDVHLESLATHTNYSDSKLQIILLAKAISRALPDVYSNAVDPGWVPTKMGGAGAPDDLQKGFETQVWLAVSEDPQAKVSGRYFYHQKESPYSSLADDTALQDKYLKECEKISQVKF
jgi:NAD(P)-dependent dehydrogenase (short-subunit alcohol dehydrogenase family)